MKISAEIATEHARKRLATECETMKQLLRGLLDSKGKVSAEVHAIRKLGKSLRGGFSLFRLDKSSSLEIQAIGRLLSGPRDAVSRYNTWKRLAWAADPVASEAIGKLLEQQTHSAARRPPPETIDWCLARVDAGLDGLQQLPDGDLKGILSKGTKRLKRRAFKRCGKLYQQSEEDFHEARKSVKALLGAAGFLPEGVLEVHPKFHDLAEFLGDENDLATLSAWLMGHGFTERFAPDLWKTLHETRRKLQKQVISDVTKLSPAEGK